MMDMKAPVKETGKNPKADIPSGREWWASQRRKYNKGVVTKQKKNRYLSEKAYLCGVNNSYEYEEKH
jgi:hypothetical protein